MLIDDLKSRLINSIDLTKKISDDEIREMISDMVMNEYAAALMPVREKMRICRELFNAIRGMDILQELLDDDDITEIMVNGAQDIFVEKEGKLYRHNGRFSSKEKLEDIIQSVAAQTNKRINESSPIMDARLKDGSRINVVLGPIAIDGPVITIRKFPKRAIDADKLIMLGSVTKEAASFLKRLVEAKYNIFISGGTGSGKTTMLNALSGFIPEEERIITIEDSAELQLIGTRNLVRLECRTRNAEGENAVNIRDLIRTSLRIRPDRIIVGEVRGAEALDMLQAMNTGHDGSISTGHANSVQDMFSRLEVMALMAGEEIPVSAIRRQIASAIDIMIHLERMGDGSRKMVDISQIEGISSDRIITSSLFEYRLCPDGSERKLIRTGTRLARIKGNMDDKLEETVTGDQRRDILSGSIIDTLSVL